MRISLLAALAAATALVPVAAQAQNRQDQGDWHRGRSDHAQARPQGVPARVAPARPQFDRGPQANVARPQAGDWQNRGDRGNWQNRADAGNWQGRGNRPQAQPGGGNWHESVGGDRGQADWHGRDAGNGGSWHQSVGGDRNRSDWHGRDDGNRGGWQQGRDDHRDWNRGNDRSHSNQAWRDHDRYSDRFHGNQAFNHDWRRDNRYDWRDYRARNRAIYHLPRYYAPYGWGYGYRRFGVGFTLNSMLFGPNYWIGDPWAYRLPPAYGPYRWVRYYDDALLVDIRTGYVVDVVYDIFW